MKVEIIIIIGVLTTVFSLLTKFVGFPDQIKKNFKRRSTEGISFWFFLLSFVSYVLWTVHGILAGDWVVYLGQGLGVVTTGVILFQIWLYKTKKEENK